VSNRLLNRARMTVSGAPGTGVATLSAALAGNLTLAQAGAVDGDVVSGFWDDGSALEFGSYLYNSAGPTLTRVTVQGSSSAGAAIALTSAAVFTACALVSDFTSLTGVRNRIINGDFRISQRNGSTATTPATTLARVYVFDRWWTYASQASKLTFQQGGTLGTFKKTAFFAHIVTAAAYAPASGELFTFNQSIESLNMHDFGWGTADAQPVTLSFRVRSSLTGTFSGAVRNSSAGRAYPFTFSVAAANTEQPVSITIPGDTGAFWPATPDNTEGLTLAFDLGAGATFRTAAGAWASGNYVGVTGANSVVANAGATFQITDVQFEVGSQANAFQRRLYTEELALCQRYFQALPANSMFGVVASPSQGEIVASLPVAMRVTPTMTIPAGTQTYGRPWIGTFTAASAAPDILSPYMAGIAFNGASGLTLGQPCVNAGFGVTLSAEL
jgi:hypothetical protein